MSRTIYNWRVYCNTEAQNVYGWSETEPNQCFHNNTHEINPLSVSMIEGVVPNEFMLKEEHTPTGGNFRCTSYKIICPPGLSEHDYSFPHPMTALTTTVQTTPDLLDDVVEVTVAPGTIIGVLTGNISPGTSVIPVSSTVLQYLMIGYYITINDTNNVDDLGRVISIDSVNSTVTVETATVHSFVAASPCYIKMGVKYVDNWVIGPSTQYIIGEGKVGGTYIPANKIIRISYLNNSPSITKNLYAILEFLY
jgi:hypothetical protein